MADPMTHSHDTATPTLSVESEYVLVPREPTEAMLNATPASYSSSFKTIWPLVCGDIYRIMIAAAPAPNPSPAAKGGETGAARAAEDVLDNLMWHLDHVRNPYEMQIRQFLIERGAMRPDNRAKVRAALVTPSPQPANAVREALRKIETAIDLGLKAHDSDGGEDDLAPFREAFGAIEVIRAALASDPAPAGEAVEPVAWRWRMAADRVWNYQEDRQRIPDAIHEALYAHPAPEDTARLREDLAEANERANANAYDRFVWKERAVTAERERDDTRKALEDAALWHDAQDKAISKQPNANVGHNGWMRNEHQEQANVLRAAARSASREGASDE